MRLRLTFAKNELMRYTGNLDLHMTLQRTLRRARVPLAYSQGFNPRPRLNLASAMPLGITSREELAEVWLKETRAVSEIEAALRENVPPGLEILKLEEVSEGTPKIPNLMQAAIYEVTLRNTPEDLDKRITAIIQAKELPREKKGKTYDLRPLIEEIERLPNTETGQAELRMRLAARVGATGRADEVLAEIGLSPTDCRIVRTRLILDE